MNEDTERRLIKTHLTEIMEAVDNLHELAGDLRHQLKEEYLAGFEEGCKAASLVRCKDCRFFLPVCITDQTIKVCAKGHNGYETFGCTEGEGKEE